MTVHPYSRIFTGGTAAPTVNDDTTLSYEVGDEWIDETNNKSYKCLDVTDGAAVWTEITGGGSGVRDAISEDTTYYVRTDGSDSNTGLANTAGGAFLTIQKGVNVAAALDTGIYNVTIQIAAGTYAEQITLKQGVGAGSITIIGDETTPANVVVSGATAFSGTGIKTVYKIKGVKGTGAGYFIFCRSSDIEMQNCNVATTGDQQIRADDLGKINITGNYTISAGAVNHWATSGNAIIRCQSRTITLSGTPAFTYFSDCSYLSAQFADGCTFTGSATGARYTVAGNGVLYVGGGGADYLPGDAAGGTSTGGQYI